MDSQLLPDCVSWLCEKSAHSTEASDVRGSHLSLTMKVCSKPVKHFYPKKTTTSGIQEEVRNVSQGGGSSLNDVMDAREAANSETLVWARSTDTVATGVWILVQRQTRAWWRKRNSQSTWDLSTEKLTAQPNKLFLWILQFTPRIREKVEIISRLVSPLPKLGRRPMDFHDGWGSLQYLPRTRRGETLRWREGWKSAPFPQNDEWPYSPKKITKLHTWVALVLYKNNTYIYIQ